MEELLVICMIGSINSTFNRGESIEIHNIVQNAVLIAVQVTIAIVEWFCDFGLCFSRGKLKTNSILMR